MYGTIATMRAKPGMEDQLLGMLEEWGRERGSRIAGPIRVYVSRSERDAGVLLNIALFDSRETYEANAKDPEQDAWYRRMVQYCAAPPEWHDHDVLLAYEFMPPVEAR
jgi:hypothetical protein